MFHCKVLVSATSANLGSGFDCFAIALNLFNQIEIKQAKDTKIFVTNNDAPTDENNLIFQAIKATFELQNQKLPNFHLTCTNNIPQGKGLGSSSAAVVAGILAANAWLGDKLNKQQILQLASKFEGHSDNAAGCIFGGAVISWCDNQQFFAINLSINQSIKSILLIPNFQSETKKARAILPKELTYQQSSFNISRSALLAVALTQNPSLLFHATDDMIHQIQRKNVMPSSIELMKNLRKLQIPAMISGAGPSVLILTSKETDTDLQNIDLLAKKFDFAKYDLEIASEPKIEIIS